MGQPVSRPGWGRRRLDVEASPVGPAECESGARRVNCSCKADKKDEAFVSASRGSSDPSTGDRLPDQGVERGHVRAGCLAAPGNAGDRQQRLQGGRPNPEKLADPHCVAGSDVRWGETQLRAVRPLSTQVVGKTQAKENLLGKAVSKNGRADINACQEYERLPSLATAKIALKMQRILLAHPPLGVNAP